MKLLVIGFDGLGFEVYKRTSLGWEPRKVESLYQNTGPCWTTIYTGVPREVHGVNHIVGRAVKQGDRDFSSLKVPCLWDILGEAGHKVALCNLPVTWPPRRVNGWIASGYPLWDKPWGWGVNVPGWYFETSDLHYHFEVPTRKTQYGFKQNDMSFFRSMSVTDMLRMGHDKAMAILVWFVLHGMEADFGFVAITWIDRLGHHKIIGEEQAPVVARWVDSEVDYLLRMLKPKKAILVSDHGFWEHKHTPDSVVAGWGIDVSGVTHIGEVAGVALRAFGLKFPSCRAPFPPIALSEAEKRLRGWRYME